MFVRLFACFFSLVVVVVIAVAVAVFVVGAIAVDAVVAVRNCSQMDLEMSSKLVPKSPF